MWFFFRGMTGVAKGGPRELLGVVEELQEVHDGQGAELASV